MSAHETTLPCSRDTARRLKERGKKGETYDKIIRDLLSLKEGISLPPQLPVDFEREERRAMIEMTYDPNIFANIEKVSIRERMNRKKLYRKQADDRFDLIVKSRVLKHQKEVFEKFLRLKRMVEK